MKNFIIFVLFGLVFLQSAQTADSASVLTKTEVYEIGVNDVLVIPVLLNTEGVPVDAISGSIKLSGDSALLSNVSEKDSFVSMWVSRPDFTVSNLTFAGIIPGGFKGVLGSGFEAYEPGVILNIVVKGNKVGETNVDINIDTLIEHNEQQNKIAVNNGHFKVIVSGKESSVEVIATDTEPPEMFTPTIVKSDYVSSTGYALVFQTYDLLSGVDHYEVKVGDNEFVRAENPYPLDKSEIHSIIYVRAIDREGNERTVKLDDGAIGEDSSMLGYVYAVIILIILFFIYREWRKRKTILV